MPESEILRVENLTVSYNGLTVLENINLSVYRSDFVGIAGPNGGGKTTLLKAMLGLVKPDRGKVVFLPAGPGSKGSRHMGYVPQSSGFDRDFPASVWDVVLTGRLGRVGLFRRFGEEDKKAAAGALEQVGMYHLKDRQAGKLSGGQIQRVLIARALAAGPRILFLDEPAASLDSHSRENLYHLLRELNESIPVVMVTHDIGRIADYASKIAFLNKNLVYSSPGEIKPGMLEAAYCCPVDFFPGLVKNNHRGRVSGQS